MKLRRRARITLEDRLDALDTALAVADGRVPDDLLAQARAVRCRVDERRARGDQAVVIALCGGTGTGKSSLFNALSGQDLATVSARRPTTTAATAWSVGDPDEAAALLDWLEIDRDHRHQHTDGTLPDGLVLVDIPDIDSVETTHRGTADRLIERVDVLAWVVDPLKYAQRNLHEGYLARLRKHADVMVVVLNQADRLDASALRTCVSDLEQLVESDGRAPRVIATSAVTGDGVPQLRKFISRVVAQRHAAAERISADIRTVAAELLVQLTEPRQAGPTMQGGSMRAGTTTPQAAGDHLGSDVTIKPQQLPPGGAADPSPRGEDARRLDPASLTELLAGLAEVDAFADRARAAYLRAARRVVRTPLLAFAAAVAGLLRSVIGGFDRLRHIVGFQRQSIPAPVGTSDPARANLEVRHALLGLVEDARRHLPWFWAERIRRTADTASDSLPAALKSALADISLEPARRRWWAATAAAWSGAEITLAAGIAWILLARLTAWLQMPRLPMPTVADDVSVPGIMIAAGIAVWILIAAARRIGVPAGAQRHRAHVAQLADHAVQRTVRDTVLAPLQEELDDYQRLRDVLAFAAT